MFIAPGIHADKYKALDLRDSTSPDWQTAVDYLQERIKSRYLDPVDLLIESEKDIAPAKKKLGFTILAIDCLLVETFQAFKDDRVIIRAYIPHISSALSSHFCAPPDHRIPSIALPPKPGPFALDAEPRLSDHRSCFAASRLSILRPCPTTRQWHTSISTPPPRDLRGRPLT